MSVAHTPPPAVHTVQTPNPDALMFRVDEVLVPAGTFEFRSKKEATRAPLAQALLSLPGIELILVAPKFVTVRKEPDADWHDLLADVTLALQDFLISGEMAVMDAQESRGPGPMRTAVEQKILALIDEEIRPAVAQDGGDVEYVGFVDGVVSLRMTGACGSCPSSTMTLKMGIEALLKEEIPEVQSVEAVPAA